MTQAFLERRREAAAAAWNLDGEVVLVAAGDEIPVPGRGDRTYPFRAHSEYLYLADRERPGGTIRHHSSRRRVVCSGRATRQLMGGLVQQPD